MNQFEREGNLPRVPLRKRQFVYVYGPLASGKSVFIEKMQEDNPGLSFCVIDGSSAASEPYIKRRLFDGAVIVYHVIRLPNDVEVQADVVVHCVTRGTAVIERGACECTTEPRATSFCHHCGNIDNVTLVKVRLHYDTGATSTLCAFRWRAGWHCAPPCSDDQPVYATPEDAAKAHIRTREPTARVIVKTERVGVGSF